MLNNKASWKVHFNIWLKHIKHDLEKGVYNQEYKWHNMIATTNNTNIITFGQGDRAEPFGVHSLGSESEYFNDNTVQNYFTVAGIKSTMSQQSINQETKKMVNSTSVVNNVTGTIKTVANQIQDSAITSAKMEAGENILLALRNIVMNKAGFMQKVKFKFAPIALDTAVVLGADVLVAELMPNKKSAKLAVECLNLAMTKEIIHALPIQEFTNALTGGKALAEVNNLINND